MTTEVSEGGDIAKGKQRSLRGSNSHSLMQFVQIYRFPRPRLVVHNHRTQAFVSESFVLYWLCGMGKLFEYSEPWFPHKVK